MRGNRRAASESLVRLLARGTLAPDDEAAARRLLGQELAWSLILHHAGSHGVFPLLAKNLGTLDVRGVPEEARVKLQAGCLANAARNGVLVRELHHVLSVLDRAGVPAIPLKGVTLAERLYGDITSRACWDIDVLVPRHAVSQSLFVLRAEGYRPAAGPWGPTFEGQQFLDSDIEITLRRGDASAPLVDLHWDIARRWRGDFKALDDLWTEASRTTWRGVSTYRLSPEWELLYLAIHSVRHRWRTLKWLVDIHDYCATQAVRWDRLTAKADGLGWGRALRLSLGLCRALLGTPLPETLAPEVPAWVRAQLQGPDAEWKDSLIPARVLDRRADRLAYLFRLFLSPTILERRLVRLPAALSPVYYVLRPLRLAARWGKPIVVSTLTARRRGIASGDIHRGGDDDEPRGLGRCADTCVGGAARLPGVGARSGRMGTRSQGEPVPQPTLRV